MRRPGEARQDQNARILRILRRDIFLRDQIHPIAQRRDQPDLGGAEEAVELGMGVAAIDVADRDHVHFGARTVDLAGLLFQQCADLLIAFDILAAGRCDLDINEIAHAFGMLVEEPADAVDPFRQPLGIIEPIDADHRNAVARRGQEPLFGLARFPAIALRVEVIPVDPDGISLRRDGAPVERDRAGRLVHLGTQFLGAVMQEAVEPFLRLEADQIVLQHRAHQALVIRQGDEQACRRPGDMEEEPDPVRDAARTQTFAERDQVIIVDPDEIVFFDQRRDRFGEGFVDALVPLAGLAFVFGQVQPVMEQRPQSRIGVAVVIFVDIALRKVDRRGRHAIMGLGIYPAAGTLFAFLPRPAEPDAAMLAQRGIERPCQPALCPGSAAGLGHCDTVRNDDEFGYRTSLQGLDNRPAQLITPTSE